MPRHYTAAERARLLIQGRQGGSSTMTPGQAAEGRSLLDRGFSSTFAAGLPEVPGQLRATGGSVYGGAQPSPQSGPIRSQNVGDLLGRMRNFSFNRAQEFSRNALQGGGTQLRDQFNQGGGRTDQFGQQKQFVQAAGSGSSFRRKVNNPNFIDPKDMTAYQRAQIQLGQGRQDVDSQRTQAYDARAERDYWTDRRDQHEQRVRELRDFRFQQEKERQREYEAGFRFGAGAKDAELQAQEDEAKAELAETKAMAAEVEKRFKEPIRMFDDFDPEVKKAAVDMFGRVANDKDFRLDDVQMRNFYSGVVTIMDRQDDDEEKNIAAIEAVDAFEDLNKMEKRIAGIKAKGGSYMDLGVTPKFLRDLAKLDAVGLAEAGFPISNLVEERLLDAAEALNDEMVLKAKR